MGDNNGIGLEAFIKMDAFKKAAGEYNRLIDNMNQQTDGVAGGITGKFEALGGSVLRVAGYLSGALVAGATAAVGALTGLAVSGVKSAMEMEAQLSGIAAVLNKTKDEVQPLADTIIDLGLDPRLKVTAEEAAEAIELLARNGLEMTEIMDGAAFSTVLLANSTGTGFGNAANIATDAMAIFSIEAKDMQQAVDGITAVTTNSKFTIDDFALALANGGAVANSSGVDFDDFNTVIAAISPQFSSGMTAGTSFKNMLLRLAPTTNTAKDAMSELGLIAEDGTNAFYDSSGALKDMDDVAQILQDTFSGLSEEQRGQYLRTIFGNEAMSSAIGLMNLGADAGISASEAFNQLANTMGETDAAESAATRMDNLAGVLEIIEGVIDTVKLQIGQSFLPLLRMLADRLLVVADEVGPKVVAFFDVASGFISDFVNALFEGQGPIDAFFGALEGAGLEANILVPMRKIVTGIRDFITIAAEFVKDHAEEFKGALVAIGAVLAGAAIAAAIAGIAGAIAALLNPVTLIVAGVAALGAAWAGNWGGIREKVQTAVDKVTDVLGKLRSWFDENKGAIQDFADNTIGRVRDKFGEVARDVGGFIKEHFQKVTDWFRENRPLIESFVTKVATVMATMYGIWLTIWSGMSTQLLNFWYVIKPILSGVIDVVLGLAETIMQMATGDWSGAWATIKETVSGAWESIKEAFGAFLDWVTGWFGSTWEEVKQTWSDNWEAFKLIPGQAWEAIQTAIAEKVAAIQEGIATKFEEIKTAVSEKVEGMKQAVLTKYQEIKDGVLEKLRALFASMGIDFDEMVLRWQAIWEDVKLIVSTIWDNIYQAVSEKVEEVRSWIEEKVTAIRDFWAPIWDEISTKVSEIWDAIVTAVTEKVEKVRSGIDAKIVETKKAWDTIWDEISTKVSEIWDAMVTAVTEKVEEVYTAVTDKIDEIKTWVEGKIEEFKTLGGDLLQGIIDGIGAKAGALLGAVTSAIENAIAAAKRRLGIESPSKVFMEFGRYTMEGFAIGVEKMQKHAAAAMTNAMGAMPGMNVDVNHAISQAFGNSSLGVGGGAPATVALDPASLAALRPGGDVTYQYILNNRSAESSQTVQDSFKILEMLGA